jgi:hypothetical protein
MPESKGPHSQICSTPWRKAQLVVKRKKPRFDRDRKRRFLEWFAATCNVRLACRQVGISQATAYRNRMSDPDFAEAWGRALEQGYVRLETKLLEMQFEAVEEPLEFDPGFDPEADFPDQKLVDPETAMALLRQHRANSSKGRASGMPGGRLASDEEVRLALARRLKAFGVRVASEDLRGDDPPPDAGSREDSALPLLPGLDRGN